MKPARGRPECDCRGGETAEAEDWPRFVSSLWRDLMLAGLMLALGCAFGSSGSLAGGGAWGRWRTVKKPYSKFGPAK
jgi:hypothetical protein